MKRLTNKLENGMYVATNITNTDELKDKLGQLEDIEEELGIDLITLFKAIMTKSVKWENEHGFVVELNKEELREIAKILTKEELEK